jgi:DNA-binding MarR family transcriptional regulator
VIGQTEKALNAILDRRLAGTGLTEPQWITLTLTIVGGGTVDRDELTRRVAGGLKVPEAEAQAHISALVAAGRLEAPNGAGSPVTVTDAGRRLYDEIRSDVARITERMWGDLPAEDLDTAGRVLSIVLERANAELAAV